LPEGTCPWEASIARGKFITLEGGEGAGKSTQAKALRERLEARGHSVLLTREPGGSPGAEQIRRLLVEGDPSRWTPLTETLLFLAARSDHVARTIEPALSTGTWVISDRFADSTVVYQGVARGLGVDKVRTLQRDALGDVVPDLTLILDVAADEGLSRTFDRKGHEDRFERFDGEFHAALRMAFRGLAADEPDRCVLIDSGRNKEDVGEAIWKVVAERFGL
jgi:dTMP kinase